MKTTGEIYEMAGRGFDSQKWFSEEEIREAFFNIERNLLESFKNRSEESMLIICRLLDESFRSEKKRLGL